MLDKNKQNKEKNREKYIDCLIDLFVDGYVTGLLMVGKEGSGVPNPWDFIDHMWSDGETSLQKFDREYPDIQTVADGEATRLYNEGVYQAGLQTKPRSKTWNTQMDDRVRDTHFYLEGQTIPFDGVFITFDGDSARFPYDFKKASNNVHCRCFLTINA